MLPLLAALRILGPLLLAVAAAWTLDAMCRRRGLLPPGFRHPWRRAAGAALVAAILWIGIFSPLGEIGLPLKADLSKVPTAELFLLHGLMATAVLGWFVLGFAGRGAAPAAPPVPASPAVLLPGVVPLAPPALSAPSAPSAPPETAEAVPEAVGPAEEIAPPVVWAEPAEEIAQPVVWVELAEEIAQPVGGAEPVPPLAPEWSAVASGAGTTAAPPPRPPGFVREVARQLGLVAASVRREVAIGAALGLAAWAAVLLALFAAAIAVWAVGGEKALPKPSAIVPWIAALPLAVRALVSLSAGFVEEIFFRGFLQPRLGIALSTAFFVLAHVSYGQPLMLVGITLLSLIYAFLVRWRQTIWPAIAAHALFDGIQLLVVIPAALRLMGQSGH